MFSIIILFYLGGIGNAKVADPEAQAVFEHVRGVSGLDASARVTDYATQVVAGTNFFLKVVSGDKCHHVRVWRDLSGNHTFHSKQEKNINDALEYF